MEETHGACQLAFRELLATDLRLDPRQWGPAPRRHAMSAGGRIGEASTSGVAPGGRDEAVLEIDCLVSCILPVYPEKSRVVLEMCLQSELSTRLSIV